MVVIGVVYGGDRGDSGSGRDSDASDSVSGSGGIWW